MLRRALPAPSDVDRRVRRRRRLYRGVSAVAGWVVGVVFLYAGVGKALAPWSLHEPLTAVGLPAGLVLPAAMAVALVDVALGGLLVLNAGARAWVPAIAGGVLVVYTGFLGVLAAVPGEQACGCLGGGAPTAEAAGPAWGPFARNAGLLACCALAWVAARRTRAVSPFGPSPAPPATPA